MSNPEKQKKQAKKRGPKAEKEKEQNNEQPKINALHHGLYDGDVLISCKFLTESSFEFDGMISLLIKDLKPRGLLQQTLVRKIAECLWRGQRAIIAETGHINREINAIERGLKFDDYICKYKDNPDLLCDSSNLSDEEARELSDMMAVKLIPRGDTGEYIFRYESRIHNQLCRYMRMLHKLQNRGPYKRKTPLPPKTEDNTSGLPDYFNMGE